MTIETIQLDWRGMRCPEPILKTARSVRELRESSHTQRVEVLADDAAFPLDIERWCTSAGVTLEDVSTRDGVFQAVLMLNQRDGEPALASPKEAATTPPEVELLDCSGMRCPEPIMKTARRARSMQPGGRLDILADDAAFPKDIEAWVRNSSVELLSIEQEGSGWRARLVAPGKLAAPILAVSAAPEAPKAPARSSGSFQQAQALMRDLVSRKEEDGQPPQPAAPLSPQQPAPQQPELQAPQQPAPAQDQGLLLDLNAAAPHTRLARVQALCGEEWVGEQLDVRCDDDQILQEVVAWSTGAGHRLKRFDVERGQLILQVEATQEEPQELSVVQPHAMVKSEQKSATYLVIHNDFESLMAAMMVANTAAVQGVKTSIFFSFWGVNLLRADQPRVSEPREKLTIIHRLFRFMMPRGASRQPLSKMHFGGAGKAMMLASMKQQNIMSLESLVEAAIENGVTFQMCTMSMNIMGIHKRDIVDWPNIEFAGVASFVADSLASDASMVF